MIRLSIGPERKSLLLMVLVVPAFLLVAALMLSAPVAAQAPRGEPEIVQLDSLPMKAPQVVYEALSPAGLTPPPGSTGYLHVHVYDDLTGRPLGGRSISVFNNADELVAEETTTCQGYIELNDLPSGAYRVLLEDDPNWVTARRANLPGGGRNTTGEWVWVRPYWRVGVEFYELANFGLGAGLRVYTYDSHSRQAETFRQPLPGVALTVKDAGGNTVASGITGCGGFADFHNLTAGQYQVMLVDEPQGAYIYPPSGEQWVTTRSGALTSIWFFTVPSPGPQGTPTPTP